MTENKNGFNDYKESLRVEALVRKASWKDKGNVPITAKNSRELEGDALVFSAFREGMSALDHKLAHQEVSMREYAKLIIWCSTELKKSFEKQILQDKREGWQITAHHWPGEDNSLRSSIGISATEFDISFKKKFDEGLIDWNGIPVKDSIAGIKNQKQKF